MAHTSSRILRGLTRAPVLVTCLVVGCAGHPARNPASPAKVTAQSVGTAAEPLPRAPTYYFERGDHEEGLPVAARLSIDGGATLTVTRNGLRVVTTSSGGQTVTGGGGLPDEVSAALRRADGTFAVVSRDGRSATFREPLGEAEPRPAASELKLVNVEAGRDSFLALTEEGKLLRSVDGGATWQEPSLPGPPGSTIAIALRTDGRGVCVRAPQRVLITQDDGARWSAVEPSKGDASVPGLADIADDGSLVLGYLKGPHRVFTTTHRVEFAPPSLVAVQKSLAVTNPPYVPPFLPENDAPEPGYRSGPDPVRAVSGGQLHTVLFREDEVIVKTLDLATLRSDAAGSVGASEWRVGLSQLCRLDAVSPVDTRPLVAARGKVVVVAFYGCAKPAAEPDTDEEGNETPKSTPNDGPDLVLLRSGDGGKTFSRVHLDGDVASDDSYPSTGLDERAKFFLLSDGSAFFSEQQQAYYSRGSDPRGRLLRIKPDGSAETVADVAPFALEETAGGALVGIALHHAKDAFRPQILAFAPDLRSHRSIPVPDFRTASGEPASPIGAYRFFGRDLDGHLVAFVIGEVASQKEHVEVRVVLKDVDQFEFSDIPEAENATMDGSHGLFVGPNESLFETADGGETFWRTSAAGWTGRLRCSEGTCDLGHVVRDGWERAGHGPLDSRTLWPKKEPKEKKGEGDPPTIACSKVGKPTMLPLEDGFQEEEGFFTRSTRLLGTTRSKNGDVSALLLVRTGTAFTTRRVPLLPKLARTDRFSSHEGPAGLLVTHALSESAGDSKAKDHTLQFAWLDAKTLRVRTGVIVGQESRVSVAVLDDGVFVHGASKGPPEAWTISGAGVVKPLKNFPELGEGYHDVRAVGRVDDFVVFSDDADLRGTIVRARVTRGSSRALPAWLMRDDAGSLLAASDHGVPSFAFVDLSTSGPRLLSVDARDESLEPESVRGLGLDSAYASHPPPCSKSDSSSFRFRSTTRGQSRMAFQIEEDEPNHFWSRVLEASPAAGTVCASDVEEGRYAQGHGSQHVVIDLTSPELSVVYGRREVAPQGKPKTGRTEDIEVQPLRCSLPGASR